MTLAIIDGDVLAYQACKARWQKKAVINDGVSEIKLDEQGNRVPLEFSAEEDRYYLEECWINFKKDLNKLLTKIYCKDFLMSVKGEDNFRNLLYPEYKINRHKDPNKQNKFVPVLRELAVHEELAVAAHGREADDLMRIWAEQARGSVDYIICTIDKDLRCIPGQHYLMNREELIQISEEEALLFYYEQLLKGDPTDNIVGVPGIGPVKAHKLLQGLNTENAFQEVVVEQYMLAYGDLWEEQLLLNGKMVYLQKHWNDYFTINDWEVVKYLRGN